MHIEAISRFRATGCTSVFELLCTRLKEIWAFGYEEHLHRIIASEREGGAKDATEMKKGYSPPSNSGVSYGAWK